MASDQPAHEPSQNSTVAAVFDDDGLGIYGTDWVLFRYDTGTDAYVKLTTSDTLNQGVGYWIIQISGNDRTLEMH